MTDRFVIEGTWTGYRPEQRRVVHREVIPRFRATKLHGLSSIQYTDGTALLLRLRPAEKGERVPEIHSYSELIRDAEKSDQRPVYRV